MGAPKTIPQVTYENVSKIYERAHDEDSVAVDDFSLHVPAGSLTVLVGSSGSGKTTLLRCVNRMVDPSSGTVLIDGTPTTVLAPVTLRRGIGYVMQESGLLPHRKIIDNVATVLGMHKVPRKAARQRAEEMMELVGLDPAIGGRYPSELSGGQRQRVGVARALAADPTMILMDEPFGAVDPIVRAGLQDTIRDLHQKLGCTIIFVTHDINEALALGDQVVVLAQRGEIMQQGSPADLVTNPANQFVADFLGLTADRQLTTVEKHGVQLVQDSHGRTIGRLT